MIELCRACKGPVESVLNLGEQYVSDFLQPGQNGLRVPLVLVKCRSCQLVQLGESVPASKLYSHFWYQSAISSSMRSSLKDLADAAILHGRLKGADYVLDIGSNDGTLLRMFPPTVYKVGFEPAVNVADISIKNQSGWIIKDYFSADRFRKQFGHGKVKVITAVAMFYDLEDPDSFVKDIKRVLAEDGIWIVQMNYLPAMLENNCYDNICHEHLEYYSLTSFLPLLSGNGLEAFRVEENSVNGGSFRIYIANKNRRQVETSIQAMLDREKNMRLDTLMPFEAFGKRISVLRDQLTSFLETVNEQGKTVYVYGASTRGNTILQYCRLHNPMIKKAVDANPEKHGRVTVGSNLPIISREQARRDKPDYLLVLPYHLLGEIRDQEKEFLQRGGHLIVPLPAFQVI